MSCGVVSSYHDSFDIEEDVVSVSIVGEMCVEDDTTVVVVVVVVDWELILSLKGVNFARRAAQRLCGNSIIYQI
jgi:hypothetical protein